MGVSAQPLGTAFTYQGRPDNGRTGLKRAVMGSVAERIVQHAPCHVLVVKSHEDELTELADTSRD
jgi:nucleotide-binding universal stress UspA family protein